MEKYSNKKVKKIIHDKVKRLIFAPKMIYYNLSKMKKVTLFAVLFSLMTISAKAQWFDFSNNHRASIGFNAGVVGYHLEKEGFDTKFADFGIGGSLSIEGCYIDFIYQRPEHRYSNQVAVDDWDDHTALAINVGYQLPVLRWLFLTPMIGYSNETTGITYANQITAENSSIVHKYESQTIEHHFNYGVGLTLRPIKWIEIGAMATSHAIYGNIAFSMSK